MSGLAAVAAAALATAVPTGGTEVAFVSAEDDDALVAVDLEARRVVARIPVADGPHNVAVVLPSRRFLLVTSPPAGRVTLVDGFSKRAVKVFAGFGSPHDVEVAGDGRHAYVTDERRGQVAVLSLTSRRVVRRVAVGPGPHDLAVSPDGRRVWVTHGPRGPAITILDTSRPERARVVGSAGGRGAHDIAFARNGLFVWVTYWDSGIVGEIRAYARTGRLRLQQRVGRLIHHVTVDLVGKVWATDHEDGRAFLLSSRTGKPLRTFSGCPGAHHVDVGPGRGRVAVACHDAGTLLVFDPVRERVDRIRAGKGLHGVAVAFLP